MNLNLYEDRANELTDIINTCNRKLLKLPEGNLRVEKQKTNLRYFYVTTPGDTHGHYIRKKDQPFIRKLAEKDYCEKLLKEAYRERSAIDEFLKQMSGTRPEDVYDNLNDYRRPLVSPLVLSDADYAKKWEAQEFEGNPYKPEEKTRDTNRGDFVRSKTEALIANMYYDLGIPYRYECPVVLSNGEKKYPDFTLLRPYDRKIFYHEHLGLLEDELYRKNFLTKVQDYTKSGIYLGDNLIITFDTDYAPLIIKDLRTMVENIFLQK